MIEIIKELHIIVLSITLAFCIGMWIGTKVGQEGCRINAYEKELENDDTCDDDP